MRCVLTAVVVLCLNHYVTGSLDDVSNADEDDSPLSRVRRGGLSMLRLGRGLQMLRLGKRGIPMMRLGRSTSDMYSPEELRYLLAALLSDEKSMSERQLPLPRYGKDLDWQTFLEGVLRGEEASEVLRRSRPALAILESDDARPIRPAPRPGRYRRSLQTMEPDNLDQSNKRAVPIPRIGREREDERDRAVPVPRFGRCLEYDRAAPLPRIGRFQDYDYPTMYDDGEKRGMHMLRLGRAMNMLRLGKRPMNMLRLGRSDVDSDSLSEAEKKALHLLRLGKRPVNMLRLGRDGQDEKRAVNSENDANEATNEDQLTHNVDDRSVKMLRLGRSAENSRTN
ncbi:hypothetical protein ScPMuIL_016222 [Solemya velum]